MAELVTSAQMRAIERTAIESGAVDGLTLMERAGEGVASAVFGEWPELAAGPRSAVVFCGPGNNGGDGFVIARLLKKRGWQVEVILCGDPGKLPPDAETNCRRWQAMGEVRLLDGEPFRLHGDLLVDALFGTGLTRPLQGLPLRRLAEAVEDAEMAALAGHGDDLRAIRTVAVDVPSGLCADSGRVLRAEPGKSGGGIGLRADLTVTFHRLKPGHFLADGPGHCGKVVVADIGLSGWITGAVQLVDRLSSAIDKGNRDHKFDHGHALVLGGGKGQGGAARLAARGALRIGAGLVTLACPPAALAENAARLDAIMLRPLVDAEGLAETLEDTRISAVLLGPGIGTGLREAGLVKAALASGRPVVLDADALTLLAGDPALFSALHPGCVLTPHGGEFARLFPDIAERLAAPATKGPALSKIDAAREAAALAGCVVLLKGPDTVIADQQGHVAVHAAVHDRAAPWLATAGSGDVLAGFIAGLMARRVPPFGAAAAAAFLHVEAARAFGPGLIAEDLPEALPGVLRALLA